jgi:hypothetical protein
MCKNPKRDDDDDDKRWEKTKETQIRTSWRAFARETPGTP